MKILNAQLYPLVIPMLKPIKMASGAITHAQTLLIRLIDEEGREGWGEASSAPLMTGETLGSIAASTEYLSSKLLGQEIANPEAIESLQDKVLYGNASAKSCYETAVMDLFAQRKGVPLYQLLANRPINANGRLEMLHMLASGHLESELEEAKQLRQLGYRQWKIKVGTGNLTNDVLRVRELSKALQGDVVSADANQGMTIEEALAIAQTGIENGLSFFEQPFPTRMIEAATALHKETGMPLCADESIKSLDDIVELANLHAAQGVSLKLIKLGGTQAMVRAGRESLHLGLKINLACKVAETSISAAATAHVGFAVGDVAWGYSMSNRYLAKDICENPLAPIGGSISLEQLQRPGLGYAPNASHLAEFASKTLAVREFRI